MLRIVIVSVTCFAFVLCEGGVASAENMTYNINWSLPVYYVELNGDTLTEGSLNLAGEVTTDGTMGGLSNDNLVSMSMAASFESKTVGPRDLSLETDEFGPIYFDVEGWEPGHSNLIADGDTIFWNALSSDAEISNAFWFDFMSDVFDDPSERIYIFGESGGFGTGSPPRIYVEASSYLYASDGTGEPESFYAQSELFFPDENGLIPLATISTSAVPEPSSLALALISGIGLAWYRRQAFMRAKLARRHV